MVETNQFLSQQNLSEYDRSAMDITEAVVPRNRVDSASQVRAHQVAGHRRSSSYGSTLDFRDYPTPERVFLSPPVEGRIITAGGRNFENTSSFMLDPEYQPLPAASHLPESIRIFEQHRKLAQEYYEYSAEIEKLRQQKTALENQLAAKEREGLRPEEFFKELRRRQSENESLSEFHKKLKEQLGQLRGDDSPVLPELPQDEHERSVIEPGFVIVSRNGTFLDDVNN